MSGVAAAPSVLAGAPAVRQPAVPAPGAAPHPVLPPRSPREERAVVEVPAGSDAPGRACLRWRLAEAVGHRPRLLVVDLHGCDAVDSGTLGLLLQAHRALGPWGGRLVLRDVSPRVERLLALTRLRGVLQVEGAVPAARAPGA